MKNWIGISALFLLPALLAAAELETRLSTSRIRAGIPVRLELISRSGDYPEFIRFPRVTDLQWENGISRSSSVVASFSGVTRNCITAYTFYVVSPGTYVIPSSPVRVGKRVFQSREIRFTAGDRVSSASSRSGRVPRNVVPGEESEEETDLKKLLFLRFAEPPARKNCYVGEEIPVRIEAFFGLQANPAYPVIRGSGGIVFRDYKKVNPENPKFDRVTMAQTEIDGRPFHRLDFRTMIRPIVPGPLSLSASIPMVVRIQDRSSGRRSRDFFDDDFFDMTPLFSRTREIRYVMKGESPSFEVLPLPVPPAGSDFLGLTGEWKVTPSLSSVQGRVGEAVTLALDIQGKGSAELLKAPLLSIPGFRVYQPEVEQRPDGAGIRYVLIPTEPGRHAVRLNVSCFRPETGKYEVTSLNREFTASPAVGIVPDAGGSRVVDTPAQVGEEPGNVPAAPRHRQTSILYLKKGPFKGVAIPYGRNGRVCRILLLAAGVLFLILCEILHFRKKSLENDPMHHRKAAAAKAKRELLAVLRNAPEAEISSLESRILSYVTDASGLPAGATLEDAASAVEKKDPELGRILRKLGLSAWAMPGSTGISREEKSALLKGLSRLAVLTLACLPLALAGASSEGEAMNAYDADKPEEAMYWYLTCQEEANPSPALLYNIGNTLYRQGKTAPALASYEKARRLAPRDRDIAENLNLVRRKLGLPEKNRVDTPAQLPAALRDQLRPDEWMTLSVIGIVVLLCAIGLRHTFRKKIVLPLAALGLLLALAAAGEALWQYRTSYAENAAVITGSAPVLSVLPSPHARHIPDVRLMPGEEVTVIEKRPGWTRIRAGGAEGWIPGTELELMP